MDKSANVENNGLDRQGQDTGDEGLQQQKHQHEQDQAGEEHDAQDQQCQNRNGQSYRYRLSPSDDSSSVQEIDIVFINDNSDASSNDNSEQRQQQQQRQQQAMAVVSNSCTDDESFSMNLTNFSGQILIRKVSPSSQPAGLISVSSSSESPAETRATTAASDPKGNDRKSSSTKTSAYQQDRVSTTVKSSSQNTRQQYQPTAITNFESMKSHRNTFSVSTSEWLDQVLEEGGQTGSMMPQDDVENEHNGQGENAHGSSPPTIPQQDKFMSPLDTLDHRQRSVSIGSVGNTHFQQQPMRRSHVRRRTLMAFPQQSMRDVIGMEELDVEIVPPLTTGGGDVLGDEEGTTTITTTTRQNGNENISSSMTSSPSFDLLQMVASPDLELARLEAILDREGAEVVRNVDGKGRTALHILGSNSDLVSQPDGQLVAKQCAILLMGLYPEAITRKDADGRMPFVLLIEKWVEWTHEQDEKKTARILASKNTMSSCREDAKESVRSKLQKLLKPNQVFGSESKGNRRNSIIRRQLSGVNSNSQRSSLNSSSNRFPPVMIFEEVEWCFEMLSIAMDHLGGNPLEGSQHTRPTLSYRKQRKDRLMLAENVASISQLIKTTMLLESNEARNKILESSVVRRALLCPQIIGPWLTSMLRYSKGVASDTSVDFLMRLSTLSVEDFIGTYRKPLLQDGVEFDEAKKLVYDAVLGLKDLTPSLLILSDERWDRALSTPLIWYCMNQEVTTSFAVSIATSDFQLIITTVIAVRDMAFGHVAEDGFSDIFPFLNIISVVFFTCLYSVIRRMCEFYALFRISSRVAWRYFLDPWHLLDFVAVLGAMIASANYQKLVDDGKDRLDIKAPVWVYAVMLGLLWLRVLSFLKAVNERLATFILALTRIFFDIRYFCAVLLVVVLLFGDVFHLLFTADREDGGNACDVDQLNPASEDFCTEQVLDSYLRVYAIIVGDFDLSDFRQTKPITMVWFLVTFIGLVVLLNTLIAIISVSYEKSHDESQLLFRRARCIFVAGNAAVEGFLRPRFFYSLSSSARMDFIKVSAAVVRWILILTFVVTVGMSAVYIASRIVRAINDSSILALIALIFLSVVVLYVFWAAMVVFAGVVARVFYGKEADKSRIKRFFNSIDRMAVEFISSYMFGVDTDGDGGEPISLSDGRNDEVMEQLSHLQKAVEQLLQEQHQQQQQLIDATADKLGTDSASGELLLPPTSD